MVKKVIGTVLSNKMQKTVVVQVERLVQHPVYKKYIKQRTKLYAHDEKNEAKIGDRVMLIACRPLSKLKRWRVYKIL
ncbi:MAG: 30S ribosomal protein S17 [candidate division WOR-3 bacterium]